MMTRTLFLLCLLTLSWPALAGAEALYRCDGPEPVFTNKAALGCPLYVPQGRVVVAPAGATLAEIWILGAGPHDAPGLPPAAPVTPSDAETPCGLYREWLLLNSKSSGGFYGMTVEERTRWFALQKAFSLSGVPTCPEQ